MRITIRQKNIEITPAVREYIDKKIVGTVRKLLAGAAGRDLPVLDIEVSRNTKHHRKGKVFQADASLSVGKTLIRAEAEDVDVHSACDLLESELRREITTFKSRRRALAFRGARVAKKDIRFDSAARMFRQGRIRNEGN